MNKNEIVIAGLIILITAYALGWILNTVNIDIGTFFSGPNTEFQMRKVVVCTDCDKQYIHTVVNITQEELSKYPALESALKGESCKEYEPGTDFWLCKVNNDNWTKIKDFIDSRRTRANGTGPFCFNFGKMYHDACYSFAFVKP